jgi:hypothetical protein
MRWWAGCCGIGGGRECCCGGVGWVAAAATAVARVAVTPAVGGLTGVEGGRRCPLFKIYLIFY